MAGKKKPTERYLKIPNHILNIRGLGLCEKTLPAHIYSFGDKRLLAEQCHTRQDVQDLDLHHLPMHRQDAKISLRQESQGLLSNDVGKVAS